MHSILLRDTPPRGEGAGIFIQQLSSLTGWGLSCNATLWGCPGGRQSRPYSQTMPAGKTQCVVGIGTHCRRFPGVFWGYWQLLKGQWKISSPGWYSSFIKEESLETWMLPESQLCEWWRHWSWQDWISTENCSLPSEWATRIHLRHTSYQTQVRKTDFMLWLSRAWISWLNGP